MDKKRRRTRAANALGIDAGRMDLYRQQLEAIYRDCRRQLLACALAVTHCPEQAEDAVQEAFCRLSRRAFDTESLKAYAFRAVRNAALDQRRRRWWRTVPLSESLFDPTGGPSDQACAGEFRARLAAAINRLSRNERETIVEHLWGELSFREIADMRGKPMGTVVSWYRRGIDRLRLWMKEEA